MNIKAAGSTCCFGLFTKIKKGSGISLWASFCAWFFHKNVPYLMLYQLTKFQCHIFFPSQDIKQNVLLSSYSWGCIFHHPRKQLLTGKKKIGRRNTKVWISGEWKEIFRWNKKYFFIIIRAMIWWKIIKNNKHKL